ncbi:MAG: YncE family protein [Polyangiales bacterium]
MRPHFVASALLLACCHAPTIERDTAGHSPPPKPACDEMLSTLAPEPQTPYVESFAWSDESTVIASIGEGSGAVRSCGLAGEPQRNGLAVYRIGVPSPKAVFRGVHATQIASLSGSSLLMVSGERFGVGTVDRDTGCFRRTSRPMLARVAMDGKRGRFFVADQFLQVWNASSLLRVAAVELTRAPSAIAYDPSTDTVVLLSPTKDYQTEELVAYDATTLKKTGSLDFPGRGNDTLLRVRPGHGEAVVMYETPCTKWPPPQAFATKAAPRCLAGYSRGLLHVRLAPLSELRRQPLDEYAGAGEWTASGKTFLAHSDSVTKLSAWNPEGGTLVERAVAFRLDARAAFAPASDRFVDQASDFSLQVHSLASDEPIFDAELPHGAPSPEPACGPGK